MTSGVVALYIVDLGAFLLEALMKLVQNLGPPSYSIAR